MYVDPDIVDMSLVVTTGRVELRSGVPTDAWG